MQEINHEDLDFVSGGHFSVGGFAKAVGEGAVSGVIGGTSTAGIKDRNFSKGGRSVAAGIVGGAIAGGVGYIINHH